MTLTVIPYRPGVVKDDPAYTARGYATGSDKIRWVRGYAESMGGWLLAASTDTIIGICRGLGAFLAPNAEPYAGITNVVSPAEPTTGYASELGIGTTNHLYVYDTRFSSQSTFPPNVPIPNIYDITPIRSTGTFSSSSFATISGSTTITVSLSGNNVATGESVYIANATAVGGIVPGGPSGTFANNPFSTTSGSRFVRAGLTAHGMNPGDVVTISGSTAVGGITPNGTFSIFQTSANLFFFENSSAASTGATGGGAGATYKFARRYICTQTDYATEFQVVHPTAATSTASGGGSSATYSLGVNGGLAAATSGVPPLTWSIDNFGHIMIACPRNGTIYQWPVDVSVAAIPLSGAPAQVLQIVVTPERFILACGCTSVGSVFDSLLVRWPDQTNFTQWTPAVGNLAGTLQLSEGSQIVAAKNSKAGTLIWTDTALYQIQYTGNLDGLYQATLLGTHCGAAGPNAIVDANGVAFWVSPSYQFFVYDGGVPRPLPCPIRTYFANDQYVVTGINPQVAGSADYQIFASFDALYSAVMWFYASSTSSGGTGITNRYVRLDIIEAANDPKAGWSVGTFDRSAWIDRGITGLPNGGFTGVTVSTPMGLSNGSTSGTIGYAGAQLYLQETGTTSGGAALSGSLSWAPIELPDPKDGNGNHLVQGRRILIDGPPTNSNLTLNVVVQRWPNGASVTKGPYTFTSSTLYQDTRIVGRQFALDWTWSSTTTSFRMGDVRVDVSEGPLR